MSHERSIMAFLAPPRSRAIASVLALALICVPLTIGALWAFPIWDDAWFWLLLEAHGTGAITTTWVDRPVMATVWSLLAPSEPAFWRAAFVAQALLWPIFGILSALLWTILFPHLRQYAMVVGCITVAPIISKVQMVTATIALQHLLSVVPSYAVPCGLRALCTHNRSSTQPSASVSQRRSSAIACSGMSAAASASEMWRS
jgi:hypothetical protein